MTTTTERARTARARRPLPRRPLGVVAEFDATAGSYDALVGANPGYHRHLRLSADRLRLPDQGRGLRLLDVGCGTGASTLALLRAAPRAHIVGVDGSAAMLDRARGKGWPETVEFVHTTLEDLDRAGVHGPFDGILAAYLLRNLDDVDAGLSTLYGLLKPGGTLAVHEYSVRGRPRSRWVWNAVCWSVIIPAGRVATGRADLYRYLRRSVLEFDSTGQLAARMRGAGFERLRLGGVTGWQRGIVHTIAAQRPDGRTP